MRRMRIPWLLLLITLISSFIFFTNLGGQDYSLDEPETLTVVKSINIYGYPSAWDGKNITITANGKDFTLIKEIYVWTWHPWLQHYIAYFGQSIFGDTAGDIRTLFALFGVLTVVFIYFFSNYLFKNKLVASLVSIHLVFLLPFFLYVRQIRYYSLTAFFSLIYLFLLFKLFKSEWNKKLTLTLILVNFFLFMSNYLSWAGSFLCFFIIAVYKKNKQAILYSCVFIFFALGWLYFFKPIGGNIFMFFSDKNLTYILKNLSYLNNYIFSLIFLIPIYFIKIYRKYFLLFCFWIFVKVFCISVFQIPHGRYLIDLFPIFMLFYGIVYSFLISKKQYLFLTITLLITVLTNINTFIYIPRVYAIELTGKYENVMPQIGEYLKSQYKTGDLFWTNEYPWYLYLSSKVPHVSKICDIKTNKLEGPTIVTSQNKIRWFIFFQNDDRLVQDFSQIPCFGNKWNSILKTNYHRVIFPIRDNTYLINDPDIVNRSFPPTKMKKNSIIIYEKDY